MDAPPALISIANVLPQMPLAAIESLLISFDAILDMSGETNRPAAIELLRQAASATQDPESKQRLLDAALALEKGEHCAYTADGRTGRQAAEAETVTAEEWERLQAEQDAAKPMEEEEEDDEDEILDEAPPTLPHLPVKHFFQGLRARAGQHFQDDRGRAVCEGTALSLLAIERADSGGFNLSFLDRNLRLTQKDILENSGNQWFQPIPSRDCLEDLSSAIHEAIEELELSDELDDDDFDLLDEIRVDLEVCDDWLSDDEPDDEAPDCTTAQTAVQLTGPDHPLSAWLQLLFAAVKVVQ